MPGSLTFQALFESIQLSFADDSGHSIMLIVSVSLLGKGKWKGVEPDADVSLSVSFGCCYVWLNLLIVSSLELVAKHRCCSFTFNVLLANVARHTTLPGKPKIISPKINFILTN